MAEILEIFTKISANYTPRPILGHKCQDIVKT